MFTQAVALLRQPVFISADKGRRAFCRKGRIPYMKVYIDGDGCPVIDQAVKIAKETQVEVVILCDTAHEIHKEDAQTIVVSQGADSVDFALVNRLCPGDIVITQDYGLAAMCLARKAFPINQNGMVYDENNIDALLSARHTAKKIRMAGGRLKGPPKRKKIQNTEFEKSFQLLLNKIL